MKARTFALPALAALVLLCAGAGAAQGLLHGLTGDWLVVVDGQVSAKAEVFLAQRARSLVLLAPELPSPVRLGIGTRDVELLDLMGIGRTSDTQLELLAQPPLSREAPFQVEGSEVLFRASGREVRLKPRPWLIGEKTGREVTEHDPTFGRKAATYTPIGEVIAGLRKAKGEVEVLVFFGSWCPHCKDHVPYLIRIEEGIGQKDFRFRYHGLPNTFGNLPEAQRFNVRAVPTAIVLVGGQEVGRIPANRWSSPESAIYDILKAAGAV